MSLEQVQEALQNTIIATNNAMVYTNIVSSTTDLLTKYMTILDHFIHNNRIGVYSIEKYKKKKLAALIEQLNEYESLFKKHDPTTSINCIIHSFNIPITQPLDNIKKSMDSIYISFKHIGIDVPKFSILDSDLTDDLVSLYGIFATTENNEETDKRLKDVKEFMQEHGISLPSTNVKKQSLDDFFSDIGKFKLDHSQIQKGKLVSSSPEGDYFNGVYQKNDESIKVTIMELPDYNINLENFRREVTSLSSITHPNIIEFIGATSSPPYWIVTARHGKTLRYYLQQADHSKNEEAAKASSHILIHPNFFANEVLNEKEKEEEINSLKSREIAPIKPSSFTISDDNSITNSKSSEVDNQIPKSNEKIMIKTSSF